MPFSFAKSDFVFALSGLSVGVMGKTGRVWTTLALLSKKRQKKESLL
jgi:hypothetical protein